MRSSPCGRLWKARTTRSPRKGNARTGIVLGTYSAGGQGDQRVSGILFRGGPSGAPALLFNSTVGNAAAGLAGSGTSCVDRTRRSAEGASVSPRLPRRWNLLRRGRGDEVGAAGWMHLRHLLSRARRFSVMSDASVFDDSLAPFSRSRRGFVMGEGGFVLWLTRGGDRGYGEIVGTAAAGADCALNAWPADPEPLVRTMSLALEDAGLAASDVDVVYASANATARLDEVEARALVTLFGGSRTVVTSVKGAIGECGASGAAACVAAVLCGAAGRVPPIAGLREADPITRPLRLADANVEAPGEIVLVNSVASGGAVVSAVLQIPAKP